MNRAYSPVFQTQLDNSANAKAVQNQAIEAAIESGDIALIQHHLDLARSSENSYAIEQLESALSEMGQ